jgi:hypothetical protein
VFKFPDLGVRARGVHKKGSIAACVNKSVRLRKALVHSESRQGSQLELRNRTVGTQLQGEKSVGDAK